MIKQRPAQYEYQESKTFMDWCRIKKLAMVHIANERYCSPFYGRKLKELGVKKGFPDYFLPVAKHGFNGAFIEMKRKKVFKVTDEQASWLRYLRSEGYATALCFGFDEAKNFIEGYINDTQAFFLPDFGPSMDSLEVSWEFLI